MRRIWDGPRRADGRQICPGFRPGVINWLSVQPVGFFYYEPGVSKPKLFHLATCMLRWAVQDPGRTFDDVTEADVEAIYDSFQTLFVHTYADQADLREFAALGGKLLADHGVDDALIAIDNFLSYYRRLLENHGGREELDAFSRFYVMPGCCHSSCYGNGPGIAQSTGMQALIRWVEQGIAPDALPTVQLDRQTEETIARGEVAGAVVQDVTQNEGRREEVAAKAREVIRKNVYTVQQVARLFGEHIAETEVMLNEIAGSYESHTEGRRLRESDSGEYLNG
jgi:feruloyl esterase